MRSRPNRRREGLSMSNAQRKLLALILALLPAGLYVGAMIVALRSGSGISGLTYGLLVVPLVVLALAAWIRPRWGGTALALAAALLAVALFLDLDLGNGQRWAEALLAAAVIFGPPLLAGLLFRGAAQHASARGQGTPESKADGRRPRAT